MVNNPLGNSVKDRKPTPLALDTKKGFATETRELALTDNDGKLFIWQTEEDCFICFRLSR